MKATLLVDRTLVMRPGKYVVAIKVYEVPANPKFPQGIKAKFLLLNIAAGHARLLLDNHEPFGFHMHTKLPGDKEYRVPLMVTDYLEAYKLFMDEVERILSNEET